ncbi:DUF21 domain-containing protein [Quillaja saponaria]|uniref:DUF21 domain-containing protein n=1 Tax=Quillaja saponaria TaxID=32244 RepID=A0AAD7Q3T0_QUISA|nr:DUF21 domain-containing protein [Quillaja saponaria]
MQGYEGITSGLALGLLSFSQVDLEVLVKAGQLQIQKNAAKIVSIVKKEHLLLCTLLIAKSLAMEGCPFFAEIIPQASCSRYGLTVGAKMSAFVRFLLLVFFPISYPISKVNLHANEAGKGGQLSHHETTIIAGALDLTQKTAKDAITPLTENFSLDINSKLDSQTMGLIMNKGHSRIPIYSRKQTNVIGLILVKNLIFCRPEDETPIKDMTIRRVPSISVMLFFLLNVTVYASDGVCEDWPLYDILNEFQKGRSHMAVVVKSKKDIANAATNAVGRPPRRDGDYLSISTDASNMYSVETAYYSATLKITIEREEEMDGRYRRRKQPNENTSFDDFECLPGNFDEEVIGIITLEDVMEEMLQEDILISMSMSTTRSELIRSTQDKHR